MDDIIATTIETDQSIATNDAVDFGWEDDRPLSGRRKKKEREIKKKTKPGTFGSMGLGPKLYRNIVHGCKFNLPTPIQRKTIPLILQGVDVVGMARTGSGKTAAFVIPILERLKQHSNKMGCRCLILSPARELALQTYSVVLKLSKDIGFRIAVVVGGDSLSDQFSQLATNPDIIVATPGRLVHLLSEVKDVSLQSIEIVVFDEADRLFEMGFADQIKEITRSMPTNRQTLLFSATMPRLLAEFTKSGLQDPEVVRLDTDSMISPDLELFFFTTRHEDKSAALLYLLKSVISENEASIVFCSTKHHVAFLHLLLQQESIEAAFVYGTMDQSARKIQVAKFRHGVVPVLLVTDVAARGVDLPLIDNVIHFDFPPVPKLFVHRSGRTARAGRAGKAYSLLTKDDLPYLLDLHLFLSKLIKPAEVWNGENEEDLGSVFGHFPVHELSLLSNVVEKKIHENEELTGLLKSANNGFKLYLKTRQSASNASMKRARQFSDESVHPLFLKYNKNTSTSLRLKNEIECEKFGQKLKEFRPTLSVFEAKVSGNRVNKEPSVSQPDPEIKPAIVNVPELSLGEFKDPQFYINYERGDEQLESGFSVHSKLDNAVLDLMGEDQGDFTKQKRQYHWDKRSRRYICLPDGEQVKGGRRIKTESGVKVSKSNNEGAGKFYETWTKQQRMRIQATGAPEDLKLIKQASGALKDMGKRYKTKQPNSTANDDLNPDQIRKRRRDQARLKWKNMPREKRRKKQMIRKSKLGRMKK